VSGQNHPAADDCSGRRVFFVPRATPEGIGASNPSGGGNPTGSRSAITRLPRKLIETLREEGLRATALKTRAALGSGAKVVVFEMQPKQVLGRTAPVQGVTARPLDEDDIPAYEVLHPDSAEVVAARVNRGDRCIAAWDGGRVVGTRWFSASSADLGDLGVSFPVRPGIAYSYDAFTAPDWRGRGIGALVTAALFECATSGGPTRVVNAVLPDNRAGQGLARGRSRPLGMLRSNRVGDWLILRCGIPPGYLGAPLPFEHARAASGRHDLETV
jgi:GNAT superfamily N-acetyltransferase